MDTACTLEMLPVAKIDQRVQAVRDFDYNIAAAAAIAAVRSTKFNSFFPPQPSPPSPERR
jgi:hypothetical protein